MWTACSTGSARSNRRCWWPPTATPTAASDFDRRAELARIIAGLPIVAHLVVVPFLATIRTCRTWSMRPTESGRVGRLGDWVAPHRGAAARLRTAARSTTRGTCCSAPAPPGCPSASCTAPAACCCSTSRSTSSTATSGAGDRVCYFTTCGWMMWNWLASVPASGATAVLYEGNPFHPGPQRLWELVADEALTFLGVSAKYVDAVEQVRVPPGRLDRPVRRCGRSPPPDRRCRPSPSSGCTTRWRPGAAETGCTWRRSRAAPTSAGASSCGDPTSAGVRGRDPGVRRSAWRSTCGTRRARAGRRRGSAANWSAPGRSRRCRWGSGATAPWARSGPATGPPTSSASPASGPTVTSPPGPSTAAWSSTVAPTRR